LGREQNQVWLERGGVRGLGNMKKMVLLFDLEKEEKLKIIS